MIQLGPYRISFIETGRFALDGGAMFGVVPKAIWNQTNPADEANRIDMRLRAVLIQTDSQNILIDCGIGTKWATKYQSIYKINHESWSLKSGLAGAGITENDITDLILTHLHFDHAGGLTTRQNPADPKSEVLPTFPNAKVYLQRRHWESAWKPVEKDRASFIRENFSLYQDDASCKRKLELIDTASNEPTSSPLPDSKEEKIFPGIQVEVSHGHTLGMQIVRISDPTGKDPTNFIYTADLIPTKTHIRIPFIMGYDNYPVFIMEEKKRLLGRAVEEKSTLVFEHCPYAIGSTVVPTEKGDYKEGTIINAPALS